MNWTQEDVRTCAKQVLNDLEFRIFRFHFLLGADLKLCCRKLAIDLDTLRSIVADIQRKLEIAVLRPPSVLVSIDKYVHRVLQAKSWSLDVATLLRFATEPVALST